MKKSMVLVLILTISIIVLQAKQFALLVYISGDNNLNDYINPDIDEIENAYDTLTANLDILICVDGSSTGYLDDGGTRTDTRYYHLTGGGSGNDGKINDLAVLAPGELNMSDPQTLIDFADWVQKNYAATEYGLIMWNHGAGWGKGNVVIKGGMSDDTSDDLMSGGAGEWRAALAGVKAQLKQDLYFIGCDMCVMSYMEVLWDMYDLCDMVVSSEANIPADGWYYDSFILSLATSAPTSHAYLGHLMVEDYKGHYGTSTKNTLTYNVINNTDSFNGITKDEFIYLKSQIFSLAQYLIIDEGGRDATDVQSCIDAAQEMSTGNFYEDFKDIWHFCYLLNNNANIGTRVKEYAVNIMDVIDKMNPEDWQYGFPNSKGLGIYLPDDSYIYYFEEQYDAVSHPWGASAAYNGSTNGACWPWTNFIYGQKVFTVKMFANSVINYNESLHKTTIKYNCSEHYVGIQITRNGKMIYESPVISGEYTDQLTDIGKFEYEVIAYTMVEKKVISKSTVISKYSLPVIVNNVISIKDNLVKTISFYNIMGKKLIDFSDSRLIDMNKLPNGTYFLILNKTEVHKIDLIK